jgi:hypothetical protein
MPSSISPIMAVEMKNRSEFTRNQLTRSGLIGGLLSENPEIIDVSKRSLRRLRAKIFRGENSSVPLAIRRTPR